MVGASTSQRVMVVGAGLVGNGEKWLNLKYVGVLRESADSNSDLLK